jgi:small subunit ribosomal protein S8
MTDPIADFLTRLRNALMVGHFEVKMPYSRLKMSIASILVKQGFIAEAKMADERTLLVVLKYDAQGQAVIRKLYRVSKPGLRVYSQSKQLPRVLGGAGIAIVSTSQGLLTDHDARQRNLGGEVLCCVY